MVVHRIRGGDHIGTVKWAIRADGEVIQGRQNNGFEPDTAVDKDGTCSFGLAMGYEQRNYGRFNAIGDKAS